MRVVLTGAHFSPATALLSELKGHAEILVIGQKYVFEGERTLALQYRISEEQGVLFKTIRTGRLQRFLSPHILLSFVKFPLGIFDSLSLLKKFAPDVVVGFGGYVSVPVCLAARFLAIPIVLHEQTQRVGLANRVLSRFAEKICITFPSSRQYFPREKVVLTGNPMREEIFKVQKTIDVPRGFKIIYVTGGSSGSHFLNQVILEIIETLLSAFVVIHQTGESRFRDFERLSVYRDSLPRDVAARYIIKKYMYPEEIGWIFRHADLVISRAGINTVLEILAREKVCLLIPLPHGQSGEQLDNAKLVQEVGIGDYLLQKDATGEALLAKIKDMVTHEELYAQHKKDAARYVLSDAGKKLARVVQLVGGKDNALRAAQ